MGRKPGVSSPEELTSFISSAGSTLLVVDTRNTDFALEPGDEKTHGFAPIGDTSRAAAINVPYDRSNSALPLEQILAKAEEVGGKEAIHVITHCGGGGRGEKSKQFLLDNGFKNVLNGGGPDDTENWAVFGDK